MPIGRWSWRDRGAVLAGLLGPLAVCGILVPLRSHVPSADAALVLVAAVVAVASFGHRIAGLLAALSAAVWFDLLLTQPYLRLSITDQRDVETFVLLLAIGAGVTELAIRGRRSRVLAVTEQSYLNAIQTTQALIEEGSSRSELANHVCTQLCGLLGLQNCRFESMKFGGLARLHADGEVRRSGRTWDVVQHGLPAEDIELVAGAGQHAPGRFVLTPTAGQAPTVAARRCAAVVADLAAPALAG